ncbi:MAG: restriction endonuclease [Alphaproteobacteria bacterium]|nr:restriction endonuclease [Alphaproteobacteria bacterium]
MKKGKAYEQLVMAIEKHFNGNNNCVFPNAKLIDVFGIKREIDVLVYPIENNKEWGVAFECRDHKRKVGLFEIDSFITKYHDLPQIKKVIIASTSGFTKDAQLKAEKYNIELHPFKNVPNTDILIQPEVSRLLSKVEITLPYYIVLEDSDILVPFFGQKVYDLNNNAEVKVGIDLVTFLQERMSYIQDQLNANHTNTAEIVCPFIPQEKWYILDCKNNKHIIKKWRIIADISMAEQTQDITEQKIDVSSAVRTAKFGKQLLLVQDDKQKCSAFIEQTDGTLRMANVIPQISIEKINNNYDNN